jgi:hypothetical protein
MTLVMNGRGPANENDQIPHDAIDDIIERLRSLARRPFEATELESRIRRLFGLELVPHPDQACADVVDDAPPLLPPSWDIPE